MKVSLVYSHTKSHWLSCQFITRNLLESYSRFIPVKKPEICQIVNYHKNISFYEIEQTTLDILKFSPESIIFLDHTPHPYELINCLDEEYLKNPRLKRPSLIFHVYGDFPLLSAGWLKCSSALKRFKIKWICASDSQVDLVKKFIKKGESSIYLAPFPIDDSKFYFDLKIRKEARKKLNIKDDEITFIYSGRLSYQKRIQDLLVLYQLFKKHSSRPTRLLLAGPFDNLGNPYIGEHFHEGEFAQKLISYFSLLDEDTKKSINYLGCVEEEALNRIYNSADIFVSLSTHNDEDYGMSPAEALSTGLPAVLTNWGGYSSFQFDDAVKLVPVKINQSKVSIDINTKVFHKEVSDFSLRMEALRANRASMALKNSRRINIKKVGKSLEDILEAEFESFKGFTPFMNKFNQIFKTAKPFVSQQPVYSDFYKEIYESYISKKS